jgi:hypothetical protein
MPIGGAEQTSLAPAAGRPSWGPGLSCTAVAVEWVGFVGYVDWLVVPAEETVLCTTFAGYDAYCATVRTWIYGHGQRHGHRVAQPRRIGAHGCRTERLSLRTDKARQFASAMR